MEKDNEIEKGKTIEFENMKKTFEYIKTLGTGGTGDTRLLRDNTTGMEFAFKKYAPKQKKYKEEFYIRFVEEIKILFRIAHPNIVRIYNYYLYPESQTGYLQMEYIEGEPIDKFSPIFSDEWNKIFIQLIDAFRYLEEKGIIHRDIRPQNILINNYGNVKVIDFGFGKMLKTKDTKEKNSVLLNWPVSKYPEEIELFKDYTHCTEIYFVGKLFYYVLSQKDISNDSFSYFDIINKMIEYKMEDRYKSFEEIYNDISKGIFNKWDFSEREKEIYLEASAAIANLISEYNSPYRPITDPQKVLKKLEVLLRKNSLEKYIQNNAELINCFLENSYTYQRRNSVSKDIIQWFYDWLISLEERKQINVIENINNRLSNIRLNEGDDLPF